MNKIAPIKFIKSLYNANHALPKAKPVKNMVQLPYTMEDEVYNKIAANYENLEYYAKMFNIPFRFAQRKNTVLANFGPNTAAFNQHAPEKEIKATIENLVNKYAVLTRK